MLLSSDNENSIMYNNIRVDVNNNVNLKEYNQVICLELSTSGKENVLQVIEELEKREDVIYVGPNYYWSLGSDDLDSTDYEDFGLQNAANIIQLSYAWDELERWQLSTVKGGN